MTGKRKSKGSAQRTAALILLGIGLLIPALSLIPLGSLWLWQNGYLLHWTGFALVAIALVYATQRRLLPKSEPGEKKTATDPAESGDELCAADDIQARDRSWSPAEEQAWDDVMRLARKTDPATITGPDKLLLLGQGAIEAVARRLHPEHADPVWHFTMPEALAIIERVSRRLRLLTVERVPFGDRLTVAQALALYRWRGALDVAGQAYDVWRVIRLMNPATAVANEAREQLSKAMMQWGRDAIARRLTEAYVAEIGRAAIDLYGGRLRVTSGALTSYISGETAADEAVLSAVRAEPLRILVAGQTGAGKSSLVNAMAREARAATDVLPATAAFTPYRLEREGFPAAVIIDSPGIGTGTKAIEALIEKAADCDLVLWVVAANRADREIDRTALDALRRHFATRLNRRRPPVVLVATHIDRLRPFGEWAPPYEPADEREKAQNISLAVEVAAKDLGFTADEAVPVSLWDKAEPYNVERLWERIADELPEAMRAQLLRCLHELKDKWTWKSVWTQASGAGRALAGAIKSEVVRKGRKQ